MTLSAADRGVSSAGPIMDLVDEAWQRATAESGVAATDRPTVAGTLLASLIGSGALNLPRPGGGRTRSRFEALVRLGELDLTVGRLAEAHCDALAILAELAPEKSELAGAADRLWGVWAAEPPNARVTATRTGDGWQLSGRKAWCSGAGIATNALVTAHAEDGPRLFSVNLAQSGARPLSDSWPTPTLRGTDTRSVEFSDADAAAIGEPDSYVQRPGFWYGAAGVAAVWLGGALGVLSPLLRASHDRELSDIDSAHLGTAVAALAAARAAVIVAADSFDADPADREGRAAVIARTTRAAVETAVAETIDRVGRSLGPAPLATDREHARRVADLQLYVRQSHADRDLADLGRRVAEVGALW